MSKPIQKVVREGRVVKIYEWFAGGWTLVKVTCCLLLSLSLVGNVYAGELRKDRVVMAIIGEAEGEGYKGMLAVACAIRNRGTLQGVYGEKAPRVVKHKYSPKTFVLAVKAYEESAKVDITGGATHWEGTKFKTPYWAHGMIVTATIGNQRFYRER